MERARWRNGPPDTANLWVRARELVLAVVSAAALVAIVAIAQDSPAPPWAWPVLGTVWILLAADYLIRLARADDRRVFVRREWVDLVAVVVPFLRVFLVGRLVRVLNRRMRARLSNRVGLYAAWLTLLAVTFSALLVLDLERDAPEANIRTLGTAVWWAFVTLFTVGYGDHYPVTPGGRIVAIVLMINSFVILSVVTASVAARFVEGSARRTEAGDADAVPEPSLRDVMDRLDRLESQLNRLDRRP
jgi:voltage-gated potassium channel